MNDVRALLRSVFVGAMAVPLIVVWLIVVVAFALHALLQKFSLDREGES